MAAFLISLLAFWPMNYLGFFLPKLLMLSLSLALCMGLLIAREEALQRLLAVLKQPLAKWVGLYFALMLLFLFLGPVLGPSTLLFPIYVGAFLLGASLKVEARSRFIGVLLGINLLAVLYGFLQIFDLDPLGSVWNEDSLFGRPFSFLGNPNWLASFLLLTAPLSLYFYELKKSAWVALLFILNLLLLGFTLSKAAWVGAFGMAFVFAWQRLKTPRSKVIFAGSCLVTLLIGLAFLWQHFGDAFQVFRSFNARLVIWKDTLEILQMHPWGQGLDDFRFVYPAFQSPDLWEYESISATVVSPHQHVLQLLFEMGPLGLLSFYALFWGVFWRGLKSKQALLFFLSLGLFGYVLSLQFGFEVLPTGFIFWLFVGMILGEGAKPLKAASLGILRLGLGLLSFLLFVLACVGAQQWRANLHFEKAQDFREAALYEQSLSEYRLAKDLYPYDSVYHLSFAEALLSAEDLPVEWEGELLQSLDQVEFLSRALEPNLPILRAWLAVHLGDSAEFYQQLDSALEKNPSAISTYRLGSDLAAKMGDSALSEQLKQQLLELLPSFWNQAESKAGRLFQEGNPWIIQMAL